MAARSTNTAILEALAQLELKLVTLIQTGLTAIKDEHSKALLDQAKLNATFASRDVVEGIRRQVDAHTSELVGLHTFTRDSAEDRGKLRAELESVKSAGPQRIIASYDRWLGYLISGASGVLAGFAVYALTHGAIH